MGQSIVTLISGPFPQASIPSLGKIKPFMTVEVDTDGWELHQDELLPYFAMSDCLVLFPNSKTSTTVWDIKNDRSVGILEGHTNMVVAGAMNTTGSTAVTMGRDHTPLPYTIKIWSLDTLQCTANLTSSSDTSSLLKDRLLLGTDHGTIQVWDIGGSAPVALMDLEGHDHVVYTIAASDTSNVALSGSNNGSMRLWDLRTGQCVRVMEEHTHWVNSVSMDSACLIAVSGANCDIEGQTAMLWDLGSGRCINSYNVGSNVHYVTMHESGSSFITSNGEVFFKAWSNTHGHDDPILNADLSSSCGSSGCGFDPSVAASRDLSRVGMCCLNKTGSSGLLVSVWK